MGALANRTHTHDPERLTFVYTHNDDGWVTAQIQEFPAAVSQGPTQHEAWQNALDALHDLTHEPTPTERVVFAVQAQADRLAELAERVGPIVEDLIDRTGRSIADAWERHQPTRLH